MDFNALLVIIENRDEYLSSKTGMKIQLIYEYLDSHQNFDSNV